MTMTPIEQRLGEIQREISATSVRLPQGFEEELNWQFSTMLSEDAWEEEDDLPSLSALSTFLNLLVVIETERRPGIGSNGRGSITAMWTDDKTRLTVDCLSDGKTLFVLTAKP